MNTLEIIIPVRNNPTSVFRLLTHLEEQMREVSGVHVTIVDDASTDDTLNVIGKWITGRDGFAITHLDEQSCCGGARNAGARVTDSDYLAFFDSDDDIADGALPKLVTACYSGADAVVWGFTRILKGGETSAWLPDEEMDADKAAVIPVGAWCKAVKRERFVPFTERMMCEDCSWWLRQADKLTSCVSIRDALYVYDQRQGTFTDAVMYFHQHPETLESLAFNDTLTRRGLDDRAPSAALRNLAELYDIRRELKRPAVKQAWASRLHADYLNILSGRWTF